MRALFLHESIQPIEICGLSVPMRIHEIEVRPPDQPFGKTPSYAPIMILQRRYANVLVRGTGGIGERVMGCHAQLELHHDPRHPSTLKLLSNQQVRLQPRLFGIG
jgi:hypothetical protein